VDLAIDSRVLFWSGIVLGTLSIGILGYAVVRYKLKHNELDGYFNLLVNNCNFWCLLFFLFFINKKFEM